MFLKGNARYKKQTYLPRYSQLRDLSSRQTLRHLRYLTALLIEVKLAHFQSSSEWKNNKTIHVYHIYDAVLKQLKDVLNFVESEVRKMLNKFCRCGYVKSDHAQYN